MSCTTDFNPTVPYVVKLSEGRLKPGKEICIKGVAPYQALCFEINLLCGSETVLLFIVRLLAKCITVYSQDGGPWRYRSPIQRGKNFLITLACNFAHYELLVDNKRVFRLTPPIPYNEITHLRIRGNVSLSAVTYRTSGCCPADEMDTLSAELSEFPNSHANEIRRSTNSGNGTLVGPSSSIDSEPRDNTDTFPVPSTSGLINDGRSNAAATESPVLPPSYEDVLKSISKQPIVGLIPYPVGDPLGMPLPQSSTTRSSSEVSVPPPSYEDTLRLSSQSVAPYPTAGAIGMPVPFLDDS